MENYQDDDNSGIIGTIITWAIILFIGWAVLSFISGDSSSESAASVNSDSVNSADESSDQTDYTNSAGDYNADDSSDNESLEFNGYPCTEDCSGHDAGYEWAQENGITQDDVDNYSGNSNSFQEGMQSYVDEN